VISTELSFRWSFFLGCQDRHPADNRGGDPERKFEQFSLPTNDGRWQTMVFLIKRFGAFSHIDIGLPTRWTRCSLSEYNSKALFRVRNHFYL
jgi:hypothetical protein